MMPTSTIIVIVSCLLIAALLTWAVFVFSTRAKERTAVMVQCLRQAEAAFKVIAPPEPDLRFSSPAGLSPDTLDRIATLIDAPPASRIGPEAAATTGAAA